MTSGWQRLCAGALATSAALAGVAGAAGTAGANRTAGRARRARGLVAGRVTAVGDSVMIDYAPDLAQDVPGVQVHAAVSEQWDAGLATVRQLRAEGALGTEAVVGLGTNGPISLGQFHEMQVALAGLRRVVFVTVHVDRPWQSEVNSVLRAGVRAMPDARLADWYRLSAPHPDWFYPDGTHLPIGGTGAQALAALVARTLRADPGRRPAGRQPSRRSKAHHRELARHRHG